ncbi:hypothetical protein PLICBS_000507 [Purpureocillium lilacinum]|uniref:uncharacterized protein n=1 Tax=Purpureocillium lilacinum TaxID=33203 RepID=UPI002082FF95|nr:hypothetical protein PLICBS_000507 [Purpureocillium lilacinum]
MAGEGFGYDYGMTPGFPNADRMDDDRFDSNSTPPLARSEEIQGYIQNIESIYHQGLQAVYPIPQHEQSAYPLPALIDPPQDQLYAYVDEHTDEQTYEHGSQSMGTLAQPLGNWTVPFLHVNGQSPQHETKASISKAKLSKGIASITNIRRAKPIKSNGSRANTTISISRT